MHRLLMALVFALISMAGSAQAADRKLYFAVSSGLNILMDVDDDAIEAEFDPGYSFTTALGVDIRAFRLEGEIGYRRADLDEVTINGLTTSIDGDISILSFMFNAYYDIEIANSPLAPYFGVGWGLIYSDLSGSTPGVRVSDGNVNSAYQVMLGLGYEINPDTVLTAGYRLLWGIGIEENLLVHDFNIGARFLF
jgi:opacity protein-like surface antigen